MHVTRGFQRRRRPVDPSRVPPGQYVTGDFPVLSAEPTPNISLDRWTFEIRGAVEKPRTWTWAEVQALPAETFTRDIHCVTKWSKLDTTWTGVSLDVLFEGTRPTGSYVLAFSDTGYTTNLPLADVMGGRAWVVWEFDGEPLDPEHGGPGAHAGAAPVLLEEREVGARDRGARPRPARLLGTLRLPRLRRPVERTALPGRLSWQVATVAEISNETATARTLMVDVPAWPGHLPGQHVDLRLTAADGYQAQRSYSIASAPEDERLELTIERVDDGEVSTFLTEELKAGDELELRGPIGGYFVWEPHFGGPLLLIAGGSGIVPLRSILRHRRASSSDVPTRLLYSVRTPGGRLLPGRDRRDDRGRRPAGDATPARRRPAGTATAGGSTRTGCRRLPGRPSRSR